MSEVFGDDHDALTPESRQAGEDEQYAAYAETMGIREPESLAHRSEAA